MYKLSYIYLRYYQGLQHSNIVVQLMFLIPWCDENICWMGKSVTTGGRAWQQDFIAIVSDYFSIPKS
jgi:hypothetical protein